MIFEVDEMIFNLPLKLHSVRINVIYNQLAEYNQNIAQIPDRRFADSTFGSIIRGVASNSSIQYNSRLPRIISFDF